MTRAFWAALLACSALLGGCSTVSGSSPAAPASASLQGGGAARYTNPVYTGNFPDPGVLRAGTTFWAFGTSDGNANVPVLTSTDLVHWTRRADAMPRLGSWVQPGANWAPEVIVAGSGYQMYYVAHDRRTGVQCVGHAEAAKPGGPYVDHAARPLVCQADAGGSIDPDPFRDAAGRLYLTWKNDGNCCNAQVWLWAQQLSPDGSRLVGRRARLLTNTRPWQGNLVEAPEMVRHGSAWVLFYSANGYASPSYGIGWASCSGPLGPCTDRSARPLVGSTDDAAGPGHCFIVTTPSGATWLLFHAWPPDAVGSVSPGRQLWLEPLTWAGGQPHVPPPTTAPQPAPNLGR